MYRIHQTLGTDHGWCGHILNSQNEFFFVSSISFLAIFADYDKLVVLKNILTMMKDKLELNYSNNVAILYTFNCCIASKKNYLFRDIVLLYYSNNAIRPYSSVGTD